MRKLSKALVFILSLVLIVTAFAVVSFAAEENTLKPVNYTKQGTFDAYDEGQIFGSNRKALGILEVADNGNKYVMLQKNPGSYTDTNGPRWDVNTGTGCMITNYPYTMFEFDIMTATGSYDGTGVYFRFYNGSTNGLVGTQVKFNNIGLSAVPYEWSHVSLVLKYNDDKTFTRYIYINGENVSGNGEKADLSGNASFADDKVNNVAVKEFLLYPSDTSKVGMDNFNFTYFPAGYLNDDLDAIANYTYKNGEGYQLPYGTTVATITDNETGEVTPYDNLTDAYAAKNDSNTLSTEYIAEYVNASGKAIYGITAENFATAFKNIPNGYTLKLWSDVTIYDALTFTADRNVTLDLNGFNLYRIGTGYVDYAAVYKEDTQTYEKSGKATNSESGAMFSLGANRVTFTITSSRPGGTLYSFGTVSERLIKTTKVDGKDVKEVVSITPIEGVASGSIFTNQAVSNTVHINGVNTYSNSIAYSEHGSGTNFSLNIDGGTHTKIVWTTTAMFHLLRGGNHTIKNATLVGNGSYVARLYGYNTYATMTFENCDIIDAHNQAETGETLIFKNCRLNSYFNTINGTVRFEGVNRFNNKYDKFTYADGVEVIADEKTYTYTYAKTVALTPGTLIPYTTDMSERSSTFSYLAYNPETDVANVTWKDFDGKVIKTEALIKGEKVDAPICKIDSVDGWRSAIASEWTDADGNSFNFVVGSADEQVYTAVRPVIDENTKYVANISNAMLSFSYVAQFHMYLYLPVEEGMDRPVITGTYKTTQAPSAASETALINRDRYYVYTWWCGAADVADGYDVTVTFTIDGVEYKQNINLNALMYAKVVLSAPTSEKEALAVANMVRYVKEAVISTGKTPDVRFDELIGSEGLYSSLPAYAESYPDDSLDLTALSEYVEKFNLKITGTPCFQLTLSEKAVDLGMTKDNFVLRTKDGVRLDLFDYAQNGKDYSTNNTKIYDLIKTFTITVTVPAVKDAETGEVITESFKLTADYSIGTYIKGASAQNPDANMNLPKAAYAFGIAALDYRNSVLDY